MPLRSRPPPSPDALDSALDGAPGAPGVGGDVGVDADRGVLACPPPHPPMPTEAHTINGSNGRAIRMDISNINLVMRLITLR